MKKILLISCLFSLIPLFLLAQSENIVIDNKIFRNKTRKSVNFNHMKHMTVEDVACTNCHHRFENGKNVLNESELTDGNKTLSCVTCHDDAKNLEKAYHNLCIKCHQNMKDFNKSTGPRLCGGCHK